LIRIGELAIMACGGEVFNEIALNLRKASPLKYAWVGSLCNDEMSYYMPAWEHQRDLASGVMNVQLDFALTDETAEGIIYGDVREAVRTRTVAVPMQSEIKWMQENELPR